MLTKEMIIVYNLIKVTIVLMILSGTMMTAQAAGTTLGIGATVTSKLELNVVAADRIWALDPDKTPLIDPEGNGISVKANQPGWTVTVDADQPTLTEYTDSYGKKTLESPMSLQANPVDGGKGYTVSPMTQKPQTLWGNGQKGSARIAGLIFTQPVSFNDEPLTKGNYRSVLTFTLGMG